MPESLLDFSSYPFNKRRCPTCSKPCKKVHNKDGFFQCENKNCSSMAWLSYKEIYLAELKRRVEVLS